MREIKFRIMYKKYLNIWLKDEYTLRDLIEMDGAGFLGDDDIVEQYTGLKDKNGKEICEGDVFRNNINGGTWRVYRNEKDAGFWVDSGEDGCSLGDFDWSRDNREWGFIKKNCEVIGNIHEDPELLND